MAMCLSNYTVNQKQTKQKIVDYIVSVWFVVQGEKNVFCFVMTKKKKNNCQVSNHMIELAAIHHINILNNL